MNESTTPRPIPGGLLRTTWIRYTISLVTVGLLLFAPAGSLSFWNGWLFMAAMFIPMLFAFYFLARKYPSLLEKRLKMREKEKEQKIYVVLSWLWFLVTFLIPGFDYRFGWSQVPLWLVLLSTLVMLAGYLFFLVAMVQNSFASRVIEIQEEQRVVDTGLYSVVRHPMYTGGAIMYTASPLVLGSYVALVPALLLPIILVIRIRNEEKVLHTGLPGYTEYAKRVRYRLIPYVW